MRVGWGFSVTLSVETLTENRYQLNPLREQALQMSQEVFTLLWRGMWGLSYSLQVFLILSMLHVIDPQKNLKK